MSQDVSELSGDGSPERLVSNVVDDAEGEAGQQRHHQVKEVDPEIVRKVENLFWIEAGNFFDKASDGSQRHLCIIII